MTTARDKELIEAKDRRIDELEAALDRVRASKAEVQDQLDVMAARCRTAEAAADRLHGRLIGREA